jgi:SsrA-binding protein
MSVVIKNKKAAYTYFLEDEFTAGIQLNGGEIKSIRNSKASITEAYCRMEKGEMWVFNMYIEEYPNTGYIPQSPRRQRKLLLKKREIAKLSKKLKNVGITLIPTLLFISKSGYAKIKFSIAKGKKLHDKRASLKEKDIERDMDRLL